MYAPFAPLQTDGYKLFHKSAYHEYITQVYANYTSRSGRLSNTLSDEGVIFVGLQPYMMKLKHSWDQTFFKVKKEVALKKLKRYVDSYLSMDYDADHFAALHDIGYLPIRIKALLEGSRVPYGVPPITFESTVPGMQWFANYLETGFSCENWGTQTAATTGKAYYDRAMRAMVETGGPVELVPYMVHDFAFRGINGVDGLTKTGFGHRVGGNLGSDSLPVIEYAEYFYGADVDVKPVIVSVPATEHSTATSWIMIESKRQGISLREAEKQYIQYIMKKAPTGIVSHVFDSFNFWDGVINTLPELKDEILARDGKLVIRPDSGNIVRILCGYREDEIKRLPDGRIFVRNPEDDPSHPDHHKTRLATQLQEHEVKGLVQCLWDIFGGTYTDVLRKDPGGHTMEHYKLLHANIGAIYGDSVTLGIQDEVYDRLKEAGFCPFIVLGAGSFSYQYVTRDTHGSAVKATFVLVTNLDTGETEEIPVCKDPATDRSKKSAKGLLRVEKEDGVFVVYDEQTREQEQQGLLEVKFEDGEFYDMTTLDEIDAVIAAG